MNAISGQWSECPPKRGKNYLLRLVLMVMVLTCLDGYARAAPVTSIWFGPDNDTADLVDLFQQPQLWTQARSKVSVLKLGPQQVSDGGARHRNSLSDMRKADAFQLLRSWGIKLAIEAPVIKKWDCTGTNTLGYTLKLIQNVKESGGQVDYISMDGALVDGLRDCGDTIETAAAKTASYIKQLKSQQPNIDVGETEPYPANSVEQIRRWYAALAANGAKPAFFHMDANVHFLDVHPDIDAAAGLRAYRDFFKGQNIPFGVIFWSGYDPAPTDEAYYKRVMAWVRRVYAAIGAPDHSVFQSWVSRSTPKCTDTDVACNTSKLRCGPGDPGGCGEKSVPINLPEGDPRIYSHTRLIDDASRILAGGR
jgi:hypothetical protein